MTNSERSGGADQRGFLTRLASDRSGNTLAMATAGIVALMGMIGGAVDMSRSYMVQSRLQQACDAGALAARKAMSGETLTDDNKNVGYRFFDFNFPAGTLGATLTSRTYSQPTSSMGTPQAVVNGTIVAGVPTTIMRAFGNETLDLTVRCSSKMEIQSADVAMVLDVTGSMTTNMLISSSGTATEDRINALHKAVRAFYTALGPGQAGGDMSRGRIRYAFIPYGTVVNVGHLLDQDQMVDSYTYQSREAVTGSVWGWTLSGESSKNWGTGWSPAAAPTDLNNASTYSGWRDYSTGSNVNINGTSYSRRRDLNSSNCNALNTIGPSGNKMLAYRDTGAMGPETLTGTTNNPPTRATSGAQPTQQVLSYTQSDPHSVAGYRYQFYSTSSGSARCRLQYAAPRTYTRDRSGTSTKAITWTEYVGTNYNYAPRTIDVSGLKALLGGWNSTLTVPALTRTSGSTSTYNNVTLSGSFTPRSVTTGGGSPASVDVTWRGCVEERTMINTITSATPIDSIPSGAVDLDTTLLANASNDDTRWRPWLQSVVYNPDTEGLANVNAYSGSPVDDCPVPALRLQEIADYDQTILTGDYPDLFDPASGGPSSYYYPYTTSLWPGTESTAARSKNTFTLRNYIQRIDASRNLTDGTLHDAGFIWGLHLLSGVGMFAADNPDRFNGQAVNRNIVFMTDGETNPGWNYSGVDQKRYAFSGFNQYDGRLAPASTANADRIPVHDRRLRIQCEAAKRQGITVWVVVITSTSTSGEAYDDLRACATSGGTFKSAATSQELIQSFTTIANSIGGLRISQ